MKKILISACLAGERVRYDGKTVPIADRIKRWQAQGRLISVCPEVSGGLGIPRPPAEITGGTALDVLDRTAVVTDTRGNDVTDAFIRGAAIALDIARTHAVEVALFKEKSPSCGVHRVYNGRFSSDLVPGSGVTVARLKRNGIRVFSENEVYELAAFLKEDGEL